MAHALRQFKVGYLDAAHFKTEEFKAPPFDNDWITTPAGARSENIKGGNNFDHQLRFNDLDFLLVNNNHHPTNDQILIIDPEKDLSKKTDRIKNVVAIFLYPDGEISDAVKNALGNHDNVPIIRDEEALASFLSERISSRLPTLKGLILVGGKSVRMGQDKGLIEYHGRPQREHVYKILEKQLDEVYFSCRDDQAEDLSNYPVITDKFSGLGPLGAILTAFQHDPNAAWLVIAVDLPNIGESSISRLIGERNTSAYATAYISTHDNWPEPLVAIWEPRSYQRALQFLSLGYSCPRKVLINSETHGLDPNSSEELANVNTPEELERMVN
jgi:molybdopterin-guanine dinucleotide biosynthesis protein A